MKELVYLLTLCIPVNAEVAIFNISSTELKKYSPVLTLKTNTMIYLQLNKFEKFKHKAVVKTVLLSVGVFTVKGPLSKLKSGYVMYSSDAGQQPEEISYVL